LKSRQELQKIIRSTYLTSELAFSPQEALSLSLRETRHLAVALVAISIVRLRKDGRSTAVAA
jgi:hypothetical protein